MASNTATNQLQYFWGVDCGSAEIKVVVLDASLQVIGKFRSRTLFPVIEHVRRAIRGDGSLPNPFQDGQSSRDSEHTQDTAKRDREESVKPEHLITATGYGRSHIPFAQEKLTEIKAHFLGVQRQLASDLAPQEPYTLIDIGGQDSKVTLIRADQVQHFVINRKCAAGTGAYIEELAHRLELKLEDLSMLARKHDKDLTLNSYCTVFAGQEVVRVLMEGEKVENLIFSLYRSVVKRITEMTTITTDAVVFSGGVLTHHPVLRELFAETFPKKRFLLAPDAQFCGALGAALYGIQLVRKPIQIGNWT